MKPNAVPPELQIKESLPPLEPMSENELTYQEAGNLAFEKEWGFLWPELNRNPAQSEALLTKEIASSLL
jgi:hypothetical protein